MIIRDMIKSDIDEVCNLEAKTFTQPWTREDFIQALLDEKYHYLVAEIKDKIAGYCGYLEIIGEGHITNVAVKVEYRGQGIGHKLISLMIKEGEARGITSFTLEVRVSNEAAIRLYENLGFEHSGIRKGFYVKPAEDAIIMWLRLIQ